MKKQLEVKQVLGTKIEESRTVCSERNAVLYALGIGFSTDQLKDEDLQYTYERHENFKIFPTFSTCLAKNDIFPILLSCPGIPKFDPMMLLHGEQHTRIIRPLVSEGNYVTRGRIIDVADKIKGALIVFQIDTYEIDGDGKETLSIVMINSCFIRGIGGFGYTKTQYYSFKGNNEYDQISPIPNRNPDKVAQQKTTPNQALLYRLSGDYNPLHVDKNMSAKGGFQTPILHGLCSYGISAKLIVQTFCKSDGDKLKNIAARFTSHVFPGETLIVSMWKNGSRIHFTTKTLERGLVTVVGHADILEDAKL